MATKGSFNPELRDENGKFIPWKKRNREKANARTRARLAAVDPIIKRKENRKWDLKRKFKITPQLREVFIKEQDYKCAICDRLIEDIDSSTWAIDHCHKNNYIRGMLCKPCNAALGLFKDDPSILRKAAEYLDITATIQNEPSIEDFETATKILEKYGDRNCTS